jgi:predicted Zn finger-like uncharacterized protein
MFTVCPKCALTLVVTAADLRVAQGYVRCGRCSSVFNALAQLSDERGGARSAEPPPPEPETEEPAGAPAPSGGSASAPPAADEESIPEDALEFNPETTDAASVFVAAAPSPEWTAATGSFKALTAANQEPVGPEPEPGAPGASEEFDVELDAALLSDIVHPAPGPAAPPAAPSAPPAAPSAPRPPPAPRRAGNQQPAATKAAHSARPPEHPAQPPPGDAGVGDAEPPEEIPEQQGARRPWLWTAGAALLALMLVAQIINHQRDALATDPRFSRPLSALYAAVGVQLTPRWDLRAYDVHQLGAIVEPGGVGAITVRASIRNAGVRPQPLPLLRVTLQDRFGNRLASRDVQPREYLPRTVAPSALLSADQRIDAELAFVDPGASAVGFELDACLPVSGGGVACANDASAR